jgi:hypothetical protein
VNAPLDLWPGVVKGWAAVQHSLLLLGRGGGAGLCWSNVVALQVGGKVLQALLCLFAWFFPCLFAFLLQLAGGCQQLVRGAS